jgi:hypothetical protein
LRQYYILSSPPAITDRPDPVSGHSIALGNKSCRNLSKHTGFLILGAFYPKSGSCFSKMRFSVQTQGRN